MASVTIQDTSISHSRDETTVTYKYLADLDAVVQNPRTALLMAQSLGLPSLYSVLAGTLLYASNITGTRTNENREWWQFDVTFALPPKGEDQEHQIENPLARPPVYNVRYIEHEYVVKKAKNVEALGSDTGDGGPYRAENTLGPIVNGALRRPDEPIVRTERMGVIVIEKNYADLGEIMDLNETYQKTTNSDSIALGSHTFTARRLKYELTESGGRQVENDVVFYPGVTEIGIHKTTDLILDNVGFEYYTADGELQRAKDDEGNDTAEPVNLTLAGLKLDDGTTQITYRDLDPVAYSSFFE